MIEEHPRTVQAGYDVLAPRWSKWMASIEGEPSERFVAELTARLEAGAKVLDLGCGDGTNARRLAERFDVVGVDISEELLRLARTAAPSAKFLQADFADLECPAGSRDAVTAFYSVVHVPRSGHSALFQKVFHWLKPGGLFLASLSTIGGPDRTEHWLGVQMFSSSFDADTNRRLVREAGFELLVDEMVPMREPEGGTAFLWVLAQRPGSAVVD
jgi:cyclopropane fatty-acyl-phospholipid synthase-like methyltransferase